MGGPHHRRADLTVLASDDAGPTHPKVMQALLDVNLRRMAAPTEMPAELIQPVLAPEPLIVIGYVEG